MKSKYLALALVPFFAADACHKSVSAIQPKKECEEVVGQNLTDEYNAGILQHKIALRQIDPHTLLHKAILENSPEVIQFLLNQGVSVDYPDRNGMSPLTIAILNCCGHAVDVLLAQGADVNPNVRWNDMGLLEIAFYMRDWVSVKALIKYGADVNRYSENWSSLLAHVINLSRNNPDFLNLAKSMINQGADLKDAAYHAMAYSQEGDLSILQLMIEKGLDVNMEFNGKSLIAHAVEMWNEEVIKLLLRSGAEINGCGSSKKYTALTTGIESGNLDRVVLLVELGADINQQVCRSSKLISPIVLAMKSGNPQIVQYLLQHGARA